MKSIGKNWYCLCMLTFSLLSTSNVTGQKSVYNVAIFLYQGVEILDFAGPTEVFAATNGFKVYTVSVDGKEVLSQGLVTVKPEFSIDNAPVPDIIVFPGGSSGASSEDPKVLSWAKTANEEGRYLMSVCTGAFILASAGLLDHLEVTTHFGAIDGLRKELPNATVLEHTRFVDNDHILTTAGVSAGIDGALHMVARIKGLEAAKATAHYMEYDKWHPEEGKIGTLNPALEEMEKQMQGTTSKTSLSAKELKSKMPFEGELLEKVTAMNEKGKYQMAADWIEKGIKWYPNSAALFGQLRIAYGQLLKPVPMDEVSFIKLIDAGKMDEATQIYELAVREYPGWKIFSEYSLNDKGYQLVREGKNEIALAVFELNSKAFPESGNVWDSLAEAYMISGNNKEAIALYKKSLQKDPGNQNAKRMLTQLGAEQ